MTAVDQDARDDAWAARTYKASVRKRNADQQRAYNVGRRGEAYPEEWGFPDDDPELHGIYRQGRQEHREDYERIVRRWKAASAARRPFCLAINQGPLNQLLLEQSQRMPQLEELAGQVGTLLYYDTVPTRPKQKLSIIVVSNTRARSGWAASRNFDRALVDARERPRSRKPKYPSRIQTIEMTP